MPLLKKLKFYAQLSQNAYSDTKKNIFSSSSKYEIETYDFKFFKENLPKYLKNTKQTISDIKNEGKYAPCQSLLDQYEFFQKQSKIIKKGDEGYFGRAYIINNKFIIFAHRGTDGLSDYDDNAKIALARWGKIDNIPEQVEVAKAFVNFVINVFGEKISKKNIEHTGHSLGAFLAEALVVKMNHGSATTFESPGSSYLFKSFQDQEDAKNKIKTYNAQPNPINTHNKQAGKVYHFTKTGGKHSINNIIVNGFDEKGGALTGPSKGCACTIL